MASITWRGWILGCLFGGTLGVLAASGGQGPMGTAIRGMSHELTNVDLDATDDLIPATLCEDQTVTVTGVKQTDHLLWTMTTSELAPSLAVVSMVPSAVDEVTIRTCNVSLIGIDPGETADFRILTFP